MKKLLTITLLILGLQVNAQFSRDQAIYFVIAELITPDSMPDKNVWAKYSSMTFQDSIELLTGDYINCPFDQNWVFFVDDLPLAFWAHPCRYIFVDTTNGNYEMYHQEWPPGNYFDLDFAIYWENIFWTNSEFRINEVLNYNCKIYPDPCHNYIYLNLAVNNNSFLDAVIFDINGIKVKELTHQFLQTGRYSQKFDISDLTEGIYFVGILFDKKVFETIKLVKY